MRSAGFLPRSSMGVLLVSRPSATEMPEMRQMTPTKMETATHPLAESPARATAMVGLNPASAKPNWVPMAMPESRTLVGKISA